MVVQMAFAFSYKSEVLFLDEPSAHLDSYAREELYELIGEYQDEGHIIFWASHMMEELDKRADYVLAIKRTAGILRDEGGTHREISCC